MTGSHSTWALCVYLGANHYSLCTQDFFGEESLALQSLWSHYWKYSSLKYDKHIWKSYMETSMVYLKPYKKARAKSKGTNRFEAELGQILVSWKHKWTAISSESEQNLRLGGS